MVYPCKSCVDSVKLTWACDLLVKGTLGHVDFPCWPVLPVFGSFLALFAHLCLPKSKT
ncbi:Succinyl-diaminopimelate desuccinylase [Gossypium arboreum]|uniref:Succinyl-diaminopimelate desuccinylase n=1 Tax=Gossypium arboreum TaxID=29729 RepID=A0A0B0NF35_GOSAR|nr:Succinyl-diaminopimelate desuccinylase [Gossypium arboreum]